MVAGNDERFDAGLLQQLQLLCDILMAHQLAVFRQVTRYQEELRLLPQGDGNQLVKDLCAIFGKLAVIVDGILPGGALLDEHPWPHDMRIGDQHDAGLGPDGGQCQEEHKHHQPVPLYVYIIIYIHSFHLIFSVQRYE